MLDVYSKQRIEIYGVEPLGSWRAVDPHDISGVVNAPNLRTPDGRVVEASTRSSTKTKITLPRHCCLSDPDGRFGKTSSTVASNRPSEGAGGRP